MRAIRKLAAWLLGSILFLAGFLKLMDPVGSGLVMEEYMKFFHVEFLRWFAQGTGMALALFETVLGAAVITGVWRRKIAIISGAVMVVFTVLTLILLIFNPEMSCGCFGEAVPMTHSQSFIKNLVLDAAWILAYVPFKKLRPTPDIKYTSFGVATVAVILFAVWSFNSIPAVDFTSMKPGTMLYSDAEEFSGFDAPVISLCDADGQYADSLLYSGDVLVFSFYDSEKIGSREWGKIESVAADADSCGMKTIIAAASRPEAGIPEKWAEKFYTCDRRTILTLNRANGGLTFISDDQIAMKWSASNLPDSGGLRELSAKDPNKTAMDFITTRKLKLQAYLLFVFAVMLLL